MNQRQLALFFRFGIGIVVAAEQIVDEEERGSEPPDSVSEFHSLGAPSVVKAVVSATVAVVVDVQTERAVLEAMPEELYLPQTLESYLEYSEQYSEDSRCSSCS